MSLPHALLGLLADGPASGYDLLKRFDSALSFVWPATQSQLYTDLGKLDRAGLIEVAARGPRGRKEYAITADGLAELRRWLTETEPERTTRNESTMRVFFLGSVERAEARAYLDREAEVAAARLATLQHVADSTDWTRVPAWARRSRIALEQGLRVTRAQLEWARWAAEEIERVTDDEDDVDDVDGGSPA